MQEINAKYNLKSLLEKMLLNVMNIPHVYDYS